ncbi:hypothetical protein [Olleya sp. R77988]|uniref:hypothetical protein n=1 Tax=Olleya sp. R77988 TaxID=3093875 RepID=UPI0037C6B668
MRKDTILNYHELLKRGVDSHYTNKVKFNEKGFKNILASITTSKLHPEINIEGENYKEHIISICNDDVITTYYSKVLVLELLNSLKSEDYNRQFQTLIDKAYYIENFIEDSDIDNFVSEEILDTVNLEHSTWYETNCLNWFTDRVFYAINDIRLKSFYDTIELDEYGSTTTVIDKLLKDSLNTNYEKMNNKMYLLILRLFDYKYNRKNFSKERFQSLAVEYRLNNIWYSKNIKYIQSKVKAIIDNGLKTKKTKTKKPRR